MVHQYEQHDEHPERKSITGRLADLLDAQNPFALQLCRLLSPAGQSYLACTGKVLEKPSNQDVMVELMHAMDAYSSCLPITKPRKPDIKDVARLSGEPGSGEFEDDDARQALQALVDALPEDDRYVRAMLFLAMLGEPVLDTVFSRTDAIGTVMRKKLKPVTEPINEQIRILRNT